MLLGGCSDARKIALFTDIHGNLTALDAVLAAIDEVGIQEMYCLGDLVGYGPDPAGVIARIRERGIVTIRGNYDDGVGKGTGDCGCYYATEQARSDGAISYAFTEGALNAREREWLRELPDDMRLEHDGVSLLLAHGSPRKINEYLLPDRQDVQLVRLAEAAAADIVCVGHVHIPYHRAMTGTSQNLVHYVSAGSAGKPKDGDPRACWTELILGDEDAVRACAVEDDAAGAVGTGDVWLGVNFHRVDYDIEAVTRDMAVAGLPQTFMDALRNG